MISLPNRLLSSWLRATAHFLWFRMKQECCQISTANTMAVSRILICCWKRGTENGTYVTRGCSELECPYLSIALAGQPYIWDSMMNDNAFRSSGLLARFELCFAKKMPVFESSETGHLIAYLIIFCCLTYQLFYVVLTCFRLSDKAVNPNRSGWNAFIKTK